MVEITRNYLTKNEHLEEVSKSVNNINLSKALTLLS